MTKEVHDEWPGSGAAEQCPPMELALVRFVCDLSYPQLSEATLAGVSTLMRDQIALQVGSSRLPWSKQILAFAEARALPGLSIIAGSRRTMSAIDAAFVNATYGHGFEYDDAHRQSASHPGSCVVSAAMAIGAEIGASMEEVIVAIVAGYEVYTRIGNLAAPDLLKRGFQPHAVLSVFGAAAVTAKLKKYDEERILNALSIALSHAAGAAEFTSTGGSVKRVHSGIGTRNGMLAAEMAAAGITGPRAFLTGNKAFYRTYIQRSAGENPERVFGPDHGFEIEKVWLKPYCCCGCNHAYIDAVRPFAGRYQDIKAITAKIQPSADVVVGTVNVNAYDPRNIVHVQYSAPVQMALALHGMGNGYAVHFDYLEGRLDISPVVETARRIKLVVDPSLDEHYAGKFVADLEIEFNDGKVQKVFVEDPIGTANNPMPKADQDGKFRELTIRVLGEAQSADLQAALYALDPKRTAREIAALSAADE